ncbi:MAG: outer membrane lipoprotein-sorting protein [Sporocytophaga sp.]|nr:outer membrane lipoprotein-sorting protein [Sporocytophaga sp.]
MKIKLQGFLAFFALALFTSSTMYISEKTPEQILKEAESKRSPWTQMSMTAELNTNAKSGTTKSIYKVYFKDEINTLVAFLEPQFEKGNLLLMVDADLWYYVRETKKPTRITPVQRLSGSVSYGDLARLGWSKDYTIVSSEETELKTEIGTSETYLLNLAAKSQGATYQKIKLWIDKKTSKPLKSEVFLLSGKMYKTMLFTKYEIVNNKEVNSQIEFTDHFNANQKSVLNFSKIAQEKTIPNRFFIKTSLAEVSDEVSE